MPLTLRFGVCLAAILFTFGHTSAQPPRATPNRILPPGLALILLNDANVQRELKMSEAQITAFAAMRTANSIKLNAGLSQEEQRNNVRKQMQVLDEATEKYLKESLRPEQTKRLTQLAVQWDNFKAFSNLEVQGRLKLSEEQKDKIKQIAIELGKRQQEIRAQVKDGNKQNEKATELSAEYVATGVALLTDEQKEIWKDLIGQPFDLDSARPHNK